MAAVFAMARPKGYSNELDYFNSEVGQVRYVDTYSINFECLIHRCECAGESKVIKSVLI
jgi:hypothetical protein